MTEIDPDSSSSLEIEAIPEEEPALPGDVTAHWTHRLGVFQHRNYRLFFAGQAISLTGTWLQNVAHGWLVYDLTNSEFLLGLVSALGALPMWFFSLPAGVAADRVSKRNLLLVTQACAMILAFALAALVHWKFITLYYLIAISFMLGTVHAFDAPMRHSFVIEMVGRRHLMSAIAMNSATFNGARIVGPAVAGVVVASIGMAGAFFLNGLSFVAALIALSLMRVSPVRHAGHASALEGLREGLRFVLGHRVIMSLLILTAVLSTFATSYAVLMPVFAKKVLEEGLSGLGYLMASTGFGALLGAVTLSILGDLQAKGKLLLIGNVTFCTMLVLFSFSRTLSLSMGLLIVAGWGVMINMALTNTLIQILSPDHLRGRVVSAYTMMFLGMAPLGSLQSGVLAEWLGAPMAVRIGAIICAATALFLSPRFIGVMPSRT